MDIRLPEEIISWMNERNWSSHHDEYHIVKRWDIWHYRAERGDAGAQGVVDYIQANEWQRAERQEGAPGDGLEFLGMHRAMLMLIRETFPQHAAFFTGWKTPPTDPGDVHDPVPGNVAFDAAKLQGVTLIETDTAFFTSEDHFGIFLETNIQATPENPDNRTPDGRFAVHNYLHNRWTDVASPVNLGDPKVNLFNARFYGWIDEVWTTYRKKTGKSDNDPQYKDLIEHYLHMMQGHHHFAKIAKSDVARPERLKTFFQDDF